MSYSIIFKTKIVTLSDGRIMHLSLRGCNNDTEGRHNNDWRATVYTRDDFIKYAESFKKDSISSKEADYFDLKIGSRYCTYYDYSMHLLRMLKKAVSFDKLMHSEKYVTFNRIDSVTVLNADGEFKMSSKEFSTYLFEHIYKDGGVRYRTNYTLLKTEKEVVEALDTGKSIEIYISK